MKKFVAILVFFALSCTPVFADLDPNFTKTYDTSKGVITFNHQGHAELLKDCASCHGQLEQFGGQVNKDFGHKVCKVCHQADATKTAPTICTGCHIKQ